jgi:hypothetical protein
MEFNSMITLPIRKVKEVLNKIFESTGYSFKDLNIKFPKPLEMTFGEDNKRSVSLLFTKNLPKISWKKFITISAWIQGIVLSDEGGTIKIKYFPDLKFSYTKDSEQLFGEKKIDLSDIEREIYSQYPDEERQKIAKVCLRYAHEWAIICSSSGMTSADFKSNKKLKKDCYNFVKDCIKEDKRHGSFIISFIVIYVILPVILKWIIERLFEKLISN